MLLIWLKTNTDLRASTIIGTEHRNKIIIYENAVRYRTDTEPGSSGSPIFDSEWEIIGIHHAGGDRDPQNLSVWLNNKGIRIDKIIADIRESFGREPGGHAILNELGLLSGGDNGGTPIPTDAPVSINTADRNMLLAIPGMNAYRADALIAYRDQHPPFASIWDLAVLEEFRFG
jgi:hypothetical protein